MNSLTHERVGHIRWPKSTEVPSRRNPPTTGGVDAPDSRVTEYLEVLIALKNEAQVRALTGTVDPDARARALGEYHAMLKAKERFESLFVTPFTAPPRVDEPKEEPHV